MIGIFVVADQTTLRLDHMTDVFAYEQLLGNSDLGKEAIRKSLDRSPLKKPLEDDWTNILPVAFKGSQPDLFGICSLSQDNNTSHIVSASAKGYFRLWQFERFKIKPTLPSPHLSHSLKQFASWKASSFHPSQTGRAAWTVPQRIIHKV